MESLQFRVPFYPNTPDDTHCFQAALRIVLGFFQPQQDYSWEELDQISAKKEGLWTWPLAGMLELKDKGFDVVLIEKFDYGRFGEEVAHAQIKHSDIQQERRFAIELGRKIDVDRRIPNIGDIVALMKRRFIVICNVNSRKLNRKKGYAGHFVVITGYRDGKLILHDPGLPPFKDRAVSKTRFEKAWQYPNVAVKNVMAFRYSPQ